MQPAPLTGIETMELVRVVSNGTRCNPLPSRGLRHVTTDSGLTKEMMQPAPLTGTETKDCSSGLDELGRMQPAPLTGTETPRCCPAQ